MFAGISVPLIAVAFGWRWAYGIAAVLALVVGLSAGRRPPRAERTSTGRTGNRLENRRLVIVLAVAFGLGTSTSAAVTTFYVDASVRGGMTPEFAGTMLAVASITAVLVRLACGMLSDKMASGHLRLCAGLILVGGAGIAMLATGTPVGMTAGAVIALGGAWGFNGVFWYAMIRAFPRSPGTITGALAPGALLGSTAGPILFGFITEASAYPVAWSVVAGIAVVAAGAMIYAGHRIGVPEPASTPP